ncbi:hypothetical protein IWQ61_000090 [Dispira simplex]|nr:hypothetical protein IWQ61_000090 [Dispira simplex]
MYPAAWFTLGVTTSIVTSFTQSLGLTLQRKSHLDQGEPSFNVGSQPTVPYYRRPLWLSGFCLFLASSFGGSLVTISLLPVTILAPLGAVTLVSNALFAKWLLNDRFNRTAVGATCLVVVGGVLIAAFGALPLPTHSLQDLLKLYQRTAFIVYFVLTEVLVLVLLGLAFLLRETGPFGPNGQAMAHQQGRRRVISWRSPALASWEALLDEEARLPTPVMMHPHQPSAANRRPDVDFVGEREDATLLAEENGGKLVSKFPTASPPQSETNAWQDSPNPREVSPRALESLTELLPPSTTDSPELYSTNREPYTFKQRHRPISPLARCLMGCGVPYGWGILSPRVTYYLLRNRTMLQGLFYGVMSGMLCSQSLLFAKSGIELLLVSFDTGVNQFTNPLAWFILVGLAVTSLSQLAFLNRSLELCSTLLIAPLTFCSYNIATLLNGIVYYDQLDQMHAYQLALVIVGTIVLSVGVFVLSWALSHRIEPPSTVDAPVIPEELLSPITHQSLADSMDIHNLETQEELAWLPAFTLSSTLSAKLQPLTKTYYGALSALGRMWPGRSSVRGLGIRSGSYTSPRITTDGESTEPLLGDYDDDNQLDTSELDAINS